MAITRLTAWSSGFSSVSSPVTITLPTGATTGDLVIISAAAKYNASMSDLTCNQGFVKLGQGGGGTVTTGADAGDSRITLFAKVLTGSEGTIQVSAGGTVPNSWSMAAYGYRTDRAWRDTVQTSDPRVSFGNDTTAAGGLTATFALGTIKPTDGDEVLLVAAFPSDAGSAVGSCTCTATGLSGGTVTAGQYAESTAGADSGQASAYWDGFTGTATGNITPTIPITGITNGYGPLAAIVIREDPDVSAGDTGTGGDDLSTVEYERLGELAQVAEFASVVAGEPKDGADTGSGAEAITSREIAVTESGTGADVATMATSPAGSDVASGTEAITQRAFTTADTGAGVESGTTGTPIETADTGSGAEAASLVAAATGADTASGAEAASLALALAVTETGSGVEAGSVLPALSGADTGSGTEAVTARQITVAESASGVESASLAYAPTVTDTGSGAEVATLALSLSVADTGAGNETASLAAAPTGADAGSGSEAITARAVTASDAGSGVENHSVDAGGDKFAGDTGTGTEAVGALGRAVADTGSGTEALAALSRPAPGDTGSGVEVAFVSLAKTGADTATGTESTSLGVTLVALEGGAIAEAALSGATLSAADVLAAFEEINLQGAMTYRLLGAAQSIVSVHEGTGATSRMEGG